MDAAVNEKDVIKPRIMFCLKLSWETSDAPTITAKPIIMQFSGRIIWRNPLIFVIVWFQLSMMLDVETSYDSHIFRFCPFDVGANRCSKE